MNSQHPLISVVMPVYNGETYLREALESILAQTYTQFELLAIDDGSTDTTAEILENFQKNDNRLIIYSNSQKYGIATSLNIGLKLARGKYIARMDSDDISLPTRIEKQVRFLDDHPDIGICGSWVQVVRRGPSIIWKYPVSHVEIYAAMLFSCAIAHPSVMMRASALHQNELLYDINADFIEDYDLWSRALPLVHFANIPDPLLQYRLHGANTDDLHADKKRQGRALIYGRFLSRLNIEYTQNDLAFHQKIGMYQYDPDYAFVQNARKWFEEIFSANARMKLIPPTTLNAELGNRWTEVCSFSQEQPYRVFLQILASPLPYKNCTGTMRVMRALIFLIRKVLLSFANLLKKRILFP